MQDQETTIAFGKLNLSTALCTFAEALDNPDVTGSFGNFLYCVKNERQVLLGYHYEKIEIDAQITYVHPVLISKESGRYKKNASAFEELRIYLSEGWVLGTNRRKGMKICFVDNGHNARLAPEKIFIIQK